MIEAFLEIIEDINLFDFISFLILFYCVIQCFLKGFSLSLISFMKMGDINNCNNCFST